MSLVSQVAEVAGVTTADVRRVLSHGGHTRADWAIAHAIEQVTGRDPYELMLTAGRAAEVARIWADTGEVAEAPAQTNPRAIHDPEVTIYPENTSPEAAPTVLPDHPSTHEDVDDSPRDQVTAWIASIFSSVIDYVHSRTYAARLLRTAAAASTVPAARQTLYTNLAQADRTNLFGLHYGIYATSLAPAA